MAATVNTAHPKSIAGQATEAVRAACDESLANGLTVTVAEGDAVVTIRPDGSKQVGKPLSPLLKPTQRTIRIR